MSSDWLNSPESDAGRAEHTVARRSDLALGGYHPSMVEMSPSATIEIPASNKSAQLWLRMLVAMGRRWPWLLVLGLITGACASYAGWKVSRPLYRSVGLVRIAYTLPPVLQVTDQNQPLQMFGTFMQSQQLLISSRRVTDMAREDPVWRTGGRPIPADPGQYFASNLLVTTHPQSEYIEIS